MTLADERLKQLGTEDERALLRCGVAADLIHKGQYGAAREALGELWRGVGERPNVEGLGDGAAAEVLLQAGVLSGWLGRVKGDQDAAKDLISESAALFERLGESNRAAAARADIALCYWREGAYSEARVMLGEAAALIKDDASLTAKTVLRFAMVETFAGRYSDAFHLLSDYAPLFDEGVSHTLRGSFHNELARVLRRLGAAERRQNYYDRAIIEYTAAIYHLEQAGHEQYRAATENNLAFLLYKLGRYRDAHEHLDRAQVLLTKIKDTDTLAQVDETRARVLIAERRYRDAERVLSGAMQTLEKGDKAALLAEALTVQGIVWARLHAYENSMSILHRAAGLAEASGAHASAGEAILALIEEHGATGRMQPDEVYEAYMKADRLLEDTQEAENIMRLRACARVAMKRLAVVQLGDENFTLPGAVHQFEAKLVERALDEAGGILTKTARLLGISHQTLDSILNKRHRSLAGKRKPQQTRLKSIIKKDA
ncbi:MAG TPA: helix-turn-helix domain-containing protein [Pyrinomonadaceae bacterium]|nr:helix-turn-helix domain-containing protein [Pyrinomonadaceae bacterium]